MNKSAAISITPDSVIYPDKYYSFAILKDGKNIFHCNERENAMFHLKDLLENKYIPLYKKEHPDREIMYKADNDAKTKYRILRKMPDGMFLASKCVECCTLELERVPCIRRVKAGEN